MPRNTRPGGITGNLDYGWKETTLNERIQAQNTWDLLKAQEESNKIAQQRLNLEMQKEKERKGEQERIIQEKIDKENEDLCNVIGLDYYSFKYFVRNYKYLNDCSKEKTELRNILNYENDCTDNSNNCVSYSFLTLVDVCLVFGLLFALMSSGITIIGAIGAIGVVNIIWIGFTKLLNSFRKSTLKYKYNVDSNYLQRKEELERKITEIENKPLKEFYEFRKYNYSETTERVLKLCGFNMRPVIDVENLGEPKDYNEFVKNIMEPYRNRYSMNKGPLI